MYKKKPPSFVLNDGGKYVNILSINLRCTRHPLK